MKSKLTIDLDEDNQPIIKIDFIDSDDVRDKMVKRFLETFASDSCWAEFKHTGNGQVGLSMSKTAQIRPIPPINLQVQGKYMLEMANEYSKLYSSLDHDKAELAKQALSQQ